MTSKNTYERKRIESLNRSELLLKRFFDITASAFGLSLSGRLLYYLTYWLKEIQAGQKWNDF